MHSGQSGKQERVPQSPFCSSVLYTTSWVGSHTPSLPLSAAYATWRWVLRGLIKWQKGCNIWPQLFELRCFCQSNWPKPSGPYLLSGWMQNRESDSKCLDKPQKIADISASRREEVMLSTTLGNTCLGSPARALKRHCCLRNEVSISVSCPFSSDSSEASLWTATVNGQKAHVCCFCTFSLSPGFAALGFEACWISDPACQGCKWINLLSDLRGTGLQDSCLLHLSICLTPQYPSEASWAKKSNHFVSTC